MGKASPLLRTTLCLVLLASCSVPNPSSLSALDPELSGSGSAALSVLIPQGLSPSRITITATGPTFNALSFELTLSNGLWSGLLGYIPAGANRAFSARAYDATHTLIYEGTTSGVAIPPRQISLVVVPLHEVKPPEPPRIVSATQSSDTVSPEQVLTFEVAVDNPRGGPLTFSWEANMGTLSLPQNRSTSSSASSRVTWQAPGCTAQPPVLTVTMLDDQGHSLLQSFSPPGLPACHWASKGAMGWPRTAHTATRLPDGRVLVSGGVTYGITETAEVYDPASDTWSDTGSMNLPREGHTATLLPDGRVLVAGGHYSSKDHETAEVYDPDSGTWRPAGAMSFPRLGHTATLLRNGQVLVTGGFNSWTGMGRTAELYNPDTGTWSLTGSMAFSRQGHSAVLLPDGRVLVVGGLQGASEDQPAKDMAELYDPDSGTWHLAGYMAIHREHFAATLLLNGKVLVSGGTASSGYLTTVELYDPATNAWTVSRPMSLTHASHTATLLSDGKVLVYGSYLMKWAELYDPDQDTWSLAGTPGGSRTDHEATLLLDGRVLVTGGRYSIVGDERTAKVYVP